MNTKKIKEVEQNNKRKLMKKLNAINVGNAYKLFNLLSYYILMRLFALPPNLFRTANGIWLAICYNLGLVQEISIKFVFNGRECEQAKKSTAFNAIAV